MLFGLFPERVGNEEKGEESEGSLKNERKLDEKGS